MRKTAGFTFISLVLPVIILLHACGGGSAGSSVGTDGSNSNCSGTCVDSTASMLTTQDVGQIIAQAVAEAQSQGVVATVAVVDRVGNVLGIYKMGPQAVLIASAPDGNLASLISGGLEGIQVPDGLDTLAAIAKAVTGAYLSSEGNAFSTRSAGQIVQEHFNPGEDNQPGGPLFGVQFSQLACSDFISGFNGSMPDAGPKRSPLGLSADPGGLPLYKNGTVVGGVGVIADGLYSVDKVISDFDRNLDEMIALAGSFGFSPPVDRRGDRITVDGKTLRFTDVDFGDLDSDPGAANFAALSAMDGSLIALPGYSDGTLKDGLVFGSPASGIRAANSALFSGLDAFIFVDNANVNRFPPSNGTDGTTLGTAALTAAEVGQILRSALAVANRARAQIRRPLNSSARVTVSVVDTKGEILGIARSRDAPVFGSDVSLQKARTAAFFSSGRAAAFMAGLPNARYFDGGEAVFADYVNSVRIFLDDPSALGSGETAFSDRAGGNLSRPFFPDGISGEPNGPLSKQQGQWSIFSTGYQLDLVNNGILQHVFFLLGLAADVGNTCAGIDRDTFTETLSGVQLANGVQIFPGSVPIYRGDLLIGGIGVSGDGVDQDDMIAFLGLHNAGEALNGAINNAPIAMRADNLAPQGVRLRFVQCPQAPFLDSDEDNVCDGK